MSHFSFPSPFFLLKRSEQTISGKIQRSPSAQLDEAFSEMDTLVSLIEPLYVSPSHFTTPHIQFVVNPLLFSVSL